MYLTYHKIYCSLLVFTILIGCNVDRELYIHSTYQDGLQEGRRQNKPIFIHFTCYGCRGVDEFGDLFMNKEVIRNELIEGFICVELLVDERTEMNMDDIRWVMKYPFSDSIRKKILKWKKVGPMNLELERHLCQKSSHPIYAFVNAEERLLIPILGYTGKDSVRFLENLRAAKRAFYLSNQQ